MRLHCEKYKKIAQGNDKEYYPTVIQNSVFSKKNWEEIYSLLDISKFRNFPVSVGCPGCTDGGYEWIKIISNKKEQTVRFEPGKPPEELSKLIEKIQEFAKEE